MKQRVLIFFQPQPLGGSFVFGKLPPTTALSWEEKEAVGHGPEQPLEKKILNLLSLASLAFPL